MSVRTDTVNLNVNVNGNKAQKELNDLRKRAADVKFEMEGLRKGTAAYIAKKTELAGITAEMDKLKRSIGLTALTQKELVKELNTMKALKASMQPFTEEWKKLDAEIKKVEKRLYDVKNGVQGFSSFFSRIKDEVKQFGLLAAGYLGFNFITSQFSNIIRGAGKLSDSLADIRRVTGLTADEVQNLNKELKSLDTRTSTQGLRDIVVIAGKLGVAKDELVSFTQAVDQLVVALGDELGDADQITTQLGKILNVFEGGITADNISKLGNAIVDLANKGVATGGFIVDFTQRLAGLAGTANVALDAAVGLAAGLEETGQRTESSSTAVIGLLGLLGKNTREFAKVAGRDVNEFARTIQDKPVEALLQLAEAVVKNKAGLSELAPAFKEIGVDGVRVQTVLGVIGSKADFFRQKIAEAGVALEGTSEITEAFALKNETFGATLDKLAKRVNSFLNSPAILSFVQSIVSGFESLIITLEKLPEWFSRNAKAIGLLTAAFLLNNLARLKSIALFPLQILGLKNLALAATTTRNAKIALAVATNLLTLNFAKAMQAWRLLAVAFRVNPFGLILTTIGSLLLVFDIFRKKAKDAGDAVKKMNTEQRLTTDLQKSAAESIRGTLATIEEQKRVLLGATSSLDAKRKALNKLISINPDFINTLKLSEDGHIKGAEAIDLYIQKLNEKAFAEAIAAKKKGLFEKVVEQQQIIDTNQLTEDELKQVGSSLTFDRSPSGALVPKGKAPIENTRKLNAQLEAKGRISDINKEITVLDEMQKKYGQVGQAREDVNNIPFVPAATDEDAEKLQREIDNFRKEIERLRRDIEINGMEADAQEVARIEDKYKELLERAKKYNFDLLQIEGLKNAELAQLFEKRFKKQFEENSAKEYEASLQASDDYFDQLRRQSLRSYAESIISKSQYEKELKRIDADETKNRIIIAQDYSGTVKKAAADVTTFKQKQEQQQTKDVLDETGKRIEASANERLARARRNILTTRPGSDARLEAEKELLKLERDLKLENDELTNEERLFIEAEFQTQVKDLEQENLKARLQNVLQYARIFQDVMTSVINAINAREERAFQQEKRRNDNKKKELKKLLDDKLISEARYNLAVQKQDEELDKKEREMRIRQAKREKSLNIFNSLVNTASAVVEALPNLGLALAVGLAGAIQTAIIQNTPLPELGKGDWIRKGDKHKDKSGGIPVKVERDEAVMSAAAMTSKEVLTVTGTTAQITSALNKRKGGANWAGGAVVEMPEWRRRQPSQINADMPRIMEQGGVVRPIDGAANNNSETNELLAAAVKELKELKEEQRKMKTKLHAIVSIKEFREEEAKYDAAKKVSGIS